jgi:hypothetical protein
MEKHVRLSREIPSLLGKSAEAIDASIRSPPQHVRTGQHVPWRRSETIPPRPSLLSGSGWTYRYGSSRVSMYRAIRPAYARSRPPPRSGCAGISVCTRCVEYCGADGASTTLAVDGMLRLYAKLLGASYPLIPGMEWYDAYSIRHSRSRD